MFPLLLMAAAIATSPAPMLADNPLAPDTSINAVSKSCAVPDAPATVAFAAVPESPYIAQLMHASGMTSVQVSIDSSGAIVDTSVIKSSGYPLLDRAALETARQSAFRPEVKDCQPIAGSYIYQVEFTQ